MATETRYTRPARTVETGYTLAAQTLETGYTRAAVTLETGYGADATPAPVNSVAPIVTGDLVQGSTLTCSDGTWTDAVSYTKQWLRDGVAISGATGSTRTVTIDDALAVITCEVTATGPGGTSAPVASTPVGPWMPTDLGLEAFLHAPWEATADAAVAPLGTDWAVRQRLWGQQTAAAQPLYDLDAGDGLAAWDPAGALRYWDLIVDPPVLTREFMAFTRAKKSSANGYLWQGSASQGPTIVSGFSLGAFYWYGNSGDRYALQALPGDSAIHTAIHIHAATYVRGRFDGADAYNTVKTTVNYTGNSISRLLTTQGGVSWKGAVRTWGILNRVPTADELATLEAWLADPQARRTDPLTVTSPAPWQTYQRISLLARARSPSWRRSPRRTGSPVWGLRLALTAGRGPR
jgi:hypothetical protein